MVVTPADLKTLMEANTTGAACSGMAIALHLREAW